MYACQKNFIIFSRLWLDIPCESSAHEISSLIFTALSVLKNITQLSTEYDQEIPQSHTADQPTAPRGRATEH